MQTQLISADVTTAQLERYARLIYDKIGIVISPQKATLLSNRLRRRLRAIGLDCYDAYYEVLRASKPNDPEWEHFLQEVTTHETYLFRDQIHWDWLRDKFVPEVVQNAKGGLRSTMVRAWSAACSTGDEAATIATCLADRLPVDWRFEILGSDIGAGAVNAAQTQTFSDRAMRLTPESYRRRFFDQRGTSFVLKPAVQKCLRFKVHNLLQPTAEQPFDLIVLKNVLIYFDRDSKRKVLANIRRALKPGGILITGAAEGVSDLLTEWNSSQGWLHRCPLNQPRPSSGEKR